MEENVNMDKALWHCNHGWTFTDVEKKKKACMQYSYTLPVFLQPNESLKCDPPPNDQVWNIFKHQLGL